MKIAILSDYLRLPYANGATLATQFLTRELERRGHEVTILGAHDPDADEADLPARYIALPSLPFRNHPGLYVPMPTRDLPKMAASWDFDVVLGQTASMLMNLGVWLRRTRRIPLISVNTIHLPSVYTVLLGERLHKNRAANTLFRDHVVPAVERHSSFMYNHSDGLVVLSSGFESYWRERGVEVPIHVIPRNVDPQLFDVPLGRDPYPGSAAKGYRLVVVCRHTREKNVARLLRIFARWIAPVIPEATLTLVGDGPDHEAFQKEAQRLGIADRTWFPGEFPVNKMADWYGHADLFVYTSQSETYGQVVSEAMWCGLPVVALEDGFGVSHQVEDGVSGSLIGEGTDEEMTDFRFGRAVIEMLRHPRRRAAMAAMARKRARERSAPERNVERFLEAFAAAQDHLDRTSSPDEDRSSSWVRSPELRRWLWMGGVFAGLGLLRAPANLNRHGRKQPSWRDRLQPTTRPAVRVLDDRQSA